MTTPTNHNPLPDYYNPPPAPTKPWYQRPRFLVPVSIGWVLVSLLCVAAMSSAFADGFKDGLGAADPAPATSTTSTAPKPKPSTSTRTQPPPPPPPPAYETLTPASFTIKLTVVEKQCFGSAGCLVTVSPELAYVGAGVPDPNGSWRLTYRILGGEEIVESIEIDGGVYTFDDEIVVDTPRESTVPTAEITAVRER